MNIGNPGAGVVVGLVNALYVNDNGFGTDATPKVPLYAGSDELETITFAPTPKPCVCLVFTVTTEPTAVK
jgi:hypothetical protein